MNEYTSAIAPVVAIAYRQPSSPPYMNATVGSDIAAAAEPKLPQPQYMPSAMPTCLAGNHSPIMRIPMTKPAPTNPRAKRLSINIR